MHSGNFECAFCNFCGKDLEQLETHLHTCERYTCTCCKPTQNMYKISDLKAHLSTKHEKHLNSVEILHVKLDRKNPQEISTRRVTGSYFF